MYGFVVGGGPDRQRSGRETEMNTTATERLPATESSANHR
jgi:hypothetical protein